MSASPVTPNSTASQARLSPMSSTSSDTPSPASSSRVSSDSGIDVFSDSSPDKGKMRAGKSPYQLFAVPETSPEQSSPSFGSLLSEARASVSSDTTEVARTGAEDSSKALLEDPFDNEYSRILFEAIDKLHSSGNPEGLNLPQLVIVGEQSSGKSSLLQTLTEIPFPVGTGICTSFPTRIVSRRTPDAPDHFRITIEDPEVTVTGLKPADEGASGYLSEGGKLTLEKFSEVMETVSEKLGIRKGKGDDKKNFVANVLKIDLSGPNRSQFGILDLPGIFSSNYKVNDEEVAAVKEVVLHYMRRSQNIVIYVSNAAVDLETSSVFDLCRREVPHDRLVGVFTKCDTPDIASQTVTTALGRAEDGRQILQNGWFVVRNRLKSDPASTDIDAVERELFGKAPWTNLPEDRRGSSSLRSHLGKLLSKNIRSAFPVIEANIKSRLDKSVEEKKLLGDLRDTLAAKQKYLRGFAHQFEEKAKLAIEQSGSLNGRMELRGAVGACNEEFNAHMTAAGHYWAFENPEMKPDIQLDQLIEAQSSGPSSAEMRTLLNSQRQSRRHQTPVTSEAFKNFSKVQSTAQFFKHINEQLSKFQGNQLPGVINPNIYPVLYQQQTAKWKGIAGVHLDRVSQNVGECVQAILRSVCPKQDDTAVLHEELLATMVSKYNARAMETMNRLNEYCAKETEQKLLQTSDQDFKTTLLAWRQLRFAFAVLGSDGSINSDGYRALFAMVHPSIEDNMAKDIHDVLKVYYNLSLKSFVHHVNNIIVEDFVSHEDGPLKWFSIESVSGLSDEEVERYTREDGDTVRKRAQVIEDIRRLKNAQEIAAEARMRTAHLGTA